MARYRKNVVIYEMKEEEWHGIQRGQWVRVWEGSRLARFHSVNERGILTIAHWRGEELRWSQFQEWCNTAKRWTHLTSGVKRKETGHSG